MGKTPSTHKYWASCLGNISPHSFQNNNIILHYTNFARMASSITLLIKASFLQILFELWWLLCQCLKYSGRHWKTRCFFPSCKLTHLLMLWKINWQVAILFLPDDFCHALNRLQFNHTPTLSLKNSYTLPCPTARHTEEAVMLFYVQLANSCFQLDCKRSYIPAHRHFVLTRKSESCFLEACCLSWGKLGHQGCMGLIPCTHTLLRTCHPGSEEPHHRCLEKDGEHSRV